MDGLYVSNGCVTYISFWFLVNNDDVMMMMMLLFFLVFRSNRGFWDFGIFTIVESIESIIHTGAITRETSQHVCTVLNFIKPSHTSPPVSHQPCISSHHTHSSSGKRGPKFTIYIYIHISSL